MSNETLAEDPLVAAMRIRELATQYFVSRTLHTAAELDVASCLISGAQPVEFIARQVGADADALYRVLRALASIGVFNETAPRVFGNTATSRLLMAEQEGSMRDLVLLFGDPTAWRSWEALMHTLRTGEPSFDQVYGQPIFEYFSGNAEAAGRFDRAMASGTRLTNGAILSAFDFRGIVSMVDVAGGVGAALAHVLQGYPDMRGVVFDLPHVAERAHAHIAAQGLAGRCQFVAGSFFDAVPSGADAYFLKHILHDWGDEDCVRILRSCRAACRPDARLLICERPVPEGNEPSSAKWIDLHMMLSNRGGRERTAQEYDGLLRRSGFSLNRIIATDTPWCLLEAQPVGSA